MPKNNWTIKNGVSGVLQLAKNGVYRKAALAGLTVLLTLVLIFAMSAAWYTNIVKTGDLIFQVEQWGFSGKVEVADVPVLAAPGDSGVIGLTMTNTGRDLVVANVSIQKSAMSTDMQKRLYFYADTSAVVAGETVERIYLNGQNSYTYSVFSQGQLTLSETVYNDVQLKWCWVYDVLGYYVQGALDPQTNKVQVAEYLQPVEYTYDEAKTTFDANGKLLTVDGQTTVAQFLATLSATDGYPGNVTVEESRWTADGYYPIQVNDSGVGVWVKLLSYSEIEKEIITDTAMGTGQTPVEAMARITITAENVLLESNTVSDPGQLQTLLDGKGTVVMQLGENMTLSRQITVPADTRAILDLNGYTLTCGNDIAFLVEEGGALTLMDGTVESNAGTLVKGGGVEITLSNLEIAGCKSLAEVKDNKSQSDSTFRMIGCTADTANVGIYLWGNGAATKNATRVIIENSRLTSGYFGVTGSGNNDCWGTELQIISSTVEGMWTGVYQPQRGSITTVSANSAISGYTGMAIKGGNLYVMDSAVTGTGDYAEPKYQTSGFSDTGDGIYVEANYPNDATYYNHILVEVSGNSVITGTQLHTQAVQVYEPYAPNVTVRLFGGSYSTDVEEFLAEGCVQTEKDGKFTITQTP